MNILLKKIGLLLAAVLYAVTIIGCTGFGAEEPIALVIVIGKHANQYEFTEKSYETLIPLINRAVYGGDISVIVADGAPRYIDILSDDGSSTDFKQDANNSIVKERRVKEYSETVVRFLKSDATRATYSEVDLLTALKEAARVLHDNENSEKHIVIMDTGISTTGRVNFTKFNLDTLDISSFINSLSETEGILPDLTGINVSFIGLGDVAYPQSIPDTTLPMLKTLWKEVLVACGVSENMIRFPISASGTVPNHYSEDSGGFPFVTVVNFNHIEISIRESTPAMVYTKGLEETTYIEIEEFNEFEDGELLLPDVGFHPNTADIIDEDNARSILKPYAVAMTVHLEMNPNTNLYLLGTTATTVQGGKGDVTLSQNRANRLRETLVSLGVPEDRLITIGVGANVPAHLREDEFRNGSFDTVLAQANRKATVYEIENPVFQEIIRFNGIDVR